MMLWKKKRMRIRMNRFILNSGLEKYETGNPIIALLIVLSLLGVSTKRRNGYFGKDLIKMYHHYIVMLSKQFL